MAPIFPQRGSQATQAMMQNLKQKAAQSGRDLAQHVMQQGESAAQSSIAEGLGNDKAIEAWQQGKESCDKVLELARESQQGGGRRGQAHTGGQRGGQTGGGQTGGGQSGGGQSGGMPQVTGGGPYPATPNPPGTIPPPHAIPGVTPTSPGPDALQETFKVAMNQMNNHAMMAQQAALSQGGTAGAAASTTFQAARVGFRGRPPGMAMNGYVVGIVAVIALIYLTWVFATAMDEVTTKRAKERKELEKAYEKALLRYASLGGQQDDDFYTPFSMPHRPRVAR